MITALFLYSIGWLAIGLGVGWRIGYSDGKQVMRDAHGLPPRDERTVTP